MNNIWNPYETKQHTVFERKVGPNGQIRVKEGDVVSPSDIVGEVKPSAGFHLANIAALLSTSPTKTAPYILRKVGDRIFKGEILAEKKKILQNESSKAYATVDGIIENINTQNGTILIKITKKQEFIPAGVWGTVKTITSESVSIETALIQFNAKVGRGFSREGGIHILANQNESIKEFALKPEHTGKILIGGTSISKEVIAKAISLGIIGIVTGGIDLKDLQSIGDNSDIGITLIATEGFGNIPISGDLLEQLNKYENYYAFIDGKNKFLTIPLEKLEESVNNNSVFLEIGSVVRITNEENIGICGKITEIVDSYTFSSGITTKAVKVLIKNNEILVPESNIEILQH